MGSKDTPSAPPPPDPYATAAAQTGSNINTAVANTALQNANEVGPLGNITYNQTGSKTIHDPNHDYYGNPTGSFTDYDIPTYTRTETLSPNQQRMLTSQQQLGQQLLDMANTQSAKAAGILSTPFDISQVPGIKDLGDPDLSRNAVEAAMNARLDPELQRDKNALNANLVGEGFQRDTSNPNSNSAYNNAMDQFNRQENDSRQQVILAGGQEQSRQLAANLAQRQQAIQEALTQRQLPLNEIAAMEQGAQIQMPQFSQYNPGNIAGTDISGDVYKSAQLAQQNYQTQMQASQASNAGLFGLGSSAVGGLFKLAAAPATGGLSFFGGG